MTRLITFIDSTSSGVGVSLHYASLEGVFFVRNAVAPSPNGTAIVSKVSISQSSTTLAVTLLTIADDADMARQREANRGLIALLSRWIADYPTEPDPDLEQQKSDFNEDRTYRPLF